MKVVPQMGAIVGGMREVTLLFNNDEGAEARPPLSVLVEDKGDTVTINRCAFMKAKEMIPESEVAIHDLLNSAIYET